MKDLYPFLTEITILDISLILIYINLIFFLSSKIAKINYKFSYLFIAIGFLHLAMTIVYYLYSLSNVADAIGYFRRVSFVFKNWSETFGQGANFIYFLLYPLARNVGLTYFGSYFVFSFIGLYGFYLLLKIGMNATYYKFSKYFLLFLLPNAHFWSVAIGKDSLIFYGICQLVYNFYFNKKIHYYIIPFVIIGFIRIHILAFIIIAYALTIMFFNKNIKRTSKITVAIIVCASIFISFPIIMERVGAKDGESVTEQFEKLENNKMQGGSSVNLQDKNILVKTFSFLFRPTLIEARNFVTLLSGLENIVWIYMFYLFYKYRLKFVVSDKQKFYIWFCFIAAFLITIPSSFILVNLGIAMRQKYMIFPFLLTALILITNKNRINFN